MTTTAVTKVCAALGRGLLAGVVGTAAMTVSSTLEAKVNRRGASTTPADAVAKVAGVEPVDEQGEKRLNNLAHWGYGTAWGVARGAIDLLGLRGPLASAAHFATVFGTEQVVLPALGVAKPTRPTDRRRRPPTCCTTPCTPGPAAPPTTCSPSTERGPLSPGSRMSRAEVRFPTRGRTVR